MQVSRDKLTKLWKKFLKYSRADKIYTILMSNTVSRIISLVTIPLILAGVAIQGVIIPIAPAIAIPLAIVTITAIVAAAVVDTMKTRRIKNLLEEYRLINKLNVAIKVQTNILQSNSKLSSALNQQLISHDLTTHKENLKIKKYSRASIQAILANQSATLPLALTQQAHNPILLLRNLIKSLFGLRSEIKGKKQLNQAINILKEEINEERSKAPNYLNLNELAKITREQRIQTSALKLIEREYLQGKILDEDLSTRFTEIQDNLEATIKRRKKQSWLVDFTSAHNPLSKYNNAKKLKNKISTIGQLNNDDSYPTSNNQELAKKLADEAKIFIQKPKLQVNNNNLHASFKIRDKKKIILSKK